MHAIVARILNAMMLLFNITMASWIIMIQWSKETWSDISRQIIGPDKPLMNSIWLDANLGRGMMVILVLFMALIIVKEKRIPSIQKRLRWNCAGLVCLTAYSYLLIYFIYAPVVQTG